METYAGSILPCVTLSLTAAGQVPLPDVDAVNQRMEEVASTVAPTGIYVEYTSYIWMNTSQAAERVIEKYAHAVEEDPDHPWADVVERAWRDLESPPEPQRRQMWVDSRSQWRTALNAPPVYVPKDVNPSAFFDDARNAQGLVWKLDSRGVTVERSGQVPETRRHLGFDEWQNLWRMHTAGGIFAGKLDLHAVRVDRDGDAWSATMATGDGRRVREYTGRVRPDGFVLPTGYRETGAEFNGFHAEFTDWKYVGFLDTWIAHRVRYVGPEPEQLTQSELLEVRPLEPGEIELVTRVPEPGRPDPIRGSVLTEQHTADASSSPASDDDAAETNDLVTGHVDRPFFRRPIVWVGAATLAIASIAVFVVRAWKR